MAIDQPITVYPHKKDNRKHTEDEMNAIADEWHKSHSGDGLIGKKVSLNDLFGKKEK